jgi:hypothetical protein
MSVQKRKEEENQPHDEVHEQQINEKGENEHGSAIW